MLTRNTFCLTAALLTCLVAAARERVCFDKDWRFTLADLVRRDRNHPSVLMWSIGNEVLEQWSSAEADTLRPIPQPHPGREGQGSGSLTQHLAEIVRRYDTTRPITAGCNEPSPGNHLYRSGALDIIGYNYHHREALDVPRNFPGMPFIFTESVSALQTRGNYMMPTTHEEMWDVVKHNDYVGGQFIWTGFDYIGEPTPYGFPARSSYFGLIDLAGFPKDTYYMYQSEWTTKPMLHLFPHWNWLPG